MMLEISEKNTVLLFDAMLLLEFSSVTKADVDGVEGVTGATEATGRFRGG